MTKENLELDFINDMKNFDLKNIEEYVKKGVDINLKDEDGNTFLHLAALREDIDAIKFLINLGIDKTIKNNQNQTAFMRAQERHLVNFRRILVRASLFEEIIKLCM